MPKKVNVDERRADLLVAVWNVIARGGLEKATVRTIARETGRSAGTLAHYFTDKDDVLVSALQLSHERIVARWEEKLRGLRGLKALRELVLDNLPLDGDRDLETRLALNYWTRAVTQESIASSQWRKGPKLIDRMITLVREGQKLEEIRDGDSAENIAERLHALIDGFSLHSLLYPERLSRERIEKLMEAELKQLEPVSRSSKKGGKVMRKRRSKVTLLSATILAAGYALYATPSDAASTESAACAASPQSGGTLVYARRAQTQELDPLQIRNGNGDIFAINQVLQGLVRSDPKGGFDLQPAIAESWDVSSDGMTYTFHIRDGIKFSDGTPVTASDVKFSLDRFADPKLNQVLAVAAVGYKGSEVIDERTIKVDLSAPVAAFLYNISIFPAYIVPKALVESQGEKFWDAPVGTGPFKVKELVHGSHITFEANRNYWEAGKPYLDEVRFNFAEDDNSRMLQLKSGGAQAAEGVPYSQISSVKDDGALVLQSNSVPLFVGMWLNHQREVLKDQAVRQAMQHALDRETINTAIYNGMGTIPNSVLPHLKFDAGADQVQPYAYDLEKAKELMAKSKHPDGFSITLQYPAGFEDYKQLGLYLKQAWKKIGIDVELLEQDQATVSDRYYQGDYDLTFPYAQFTSDVVVPDEYAYLLNDPANELYGFFSWWHDDAVWQKVQKFGTTTNEKERAELWPQIQQQMLDISPVINVMNLPFLNAHAQNVCGADVDALGSDHLENFWLAPNQ